VWLFSIYKLYWLCFAGMHGAAVSMALHMSIGMPRCCAVIEVYNSRTKFGSYRFHGNALRSMGIYYSRVNSIEYTLPAAGHQLHHSHKCPNHTSRVLVEKERTPSIPLHEQQRNLFQSDLHVVDRHSVSSGYRRLARNSPVDFVTINISKILHKLNRIMDMFQTSESSPPALSFDYRNGSCLLSEVLDDPNLVVSATARAV
jgi:hypothetical protein